MATARWGTVRQEIQSDTARPEAQVEVIEEAVEEVAEEGMARRIRIVTRRTAQAEMQRGATGSCRRVQQAILMDAADLQMQQEGTATRRDSAAT